MAVTPALRSFAGAEDACQALAGTMAGIVQDGSCAPVAVMLSGGRTPAPIYDRLARLSIRASGMAHIMFSDERMVPATSPESNYRLARGMIEALAIPAERVLRVRTEMTPDQAAARYHEDLADFLRRGRIVFGLLGLGTDGHTASLFSATDVAAGRGRYAIAASGPSGGMRVSVTRDLLSRVERIVILALGKEKAPIVRALLHDPLRLPAGLAVADSPNVELWTDVAV